MFLNNFLTVFDLRCFNDLQISIMLDLRCNFTIPLFKSFLSLLLIIENPISMGAN